MSRYLIDRIAATPNIELHPYTELIHLHGEPESGLNGASWRDRQSGAEYQCPARNIFLFIGAVPETDWLEGCGVAVDKHGFVLTGEAARGGFPARPPPRWKPACRACSRSATCARARSSASAVPSAKAPRWSR